MAPMARVLLMAAEPVVNQPFQLGIQALRQPGDVAWEGLVLWLKVGRWY